MTVTQAPLDPAFERTPGEIAAANAGIPQDDYEFVDYFGVDERAKFFLPDGRQWIEYSSSLTEGQVKKYQKSVNRSVIVQRSSGDSKLNVDVAEDRHALIKAAVTGWFLLTVDSRTGSRVEVPFRDAEITRVLDKFPSKIIAKLEQAIREANPALTGEQTLEEIDEEIKRMQERREEKFKESQGNVG